MKLQNFPSDSWDLLIDLEFAGGHGWVVCVCWSMRMRMLRLLDGDISDALPTLTRPHARRQHAAGPARSGNRGQQRRQHAASVSGAALAAQVVG